MESQPQSSSRPSLLDTPYGTLMAAPSNTTTSTASSSANFRPPDHTENDTRSALTRLSASVIHPKSSEYRIQYIETKGFRHIKLISDLDRASSHVETHDAALVEMVHELNHLYKAPDRFFNDKDVDSVVERHNARYKDIEMALSEAKSHSGSNTAWSGTVSVKSTNFPHTVGKRMGQRISTTAGKAVSALDRHKSRGWEEL